MHSPSVSQTRSPIRKQERNKHQLEDVFHLNQSLEEKVKPTAANETIQVANSELETKFSGYVEQIAKIKYEHQIQLEEQYEKEFYEVKLEYDKFIEANNEEDLLKKLEQEKNDTINERSRLLQNTFNMSLVLGEKKKQLKMTEREDEELDEELKFLMKKIDQADELKLETEEKILRLKSGEIFRLEPLSLFYRIRGNGCQQR